MPIISRVGARSFKVQLLYAGIFLVLALGSLSMLYPLALMLSGSVKSETDFFWVTPYPRYLFDDEILYMKYVESRYGTIVEAEPSRGQVIGSWRKVTPPSEVDRELLDDFLAWRRDPDMPPSWYRLGHIQRVGENRRRFIARIKQTFHHDVQAYAAASGTGITTWSSMQVPQEQDIYSRRYRPQANDVFTQHYLDFKTSSQPSDRVIVHLDGYFWRRFLVPKYGLDIQRYNQEHDTGYSSYREVFLTQRAPAGGLERTDWEQFVRRELGLPFIRLDPEIAPAYRQFLANQEKYHAGIEQLNKAYGTGYRSFDEVEFPTVVPRDLLAKEDWSSFIKDRGTSPLEAFEVHGPRQTFEQFAAGRRGVPVGKIAPLPMPIEQADYHDLMARKGTYRWEFLRRNYLLVLDYILLHGNGIKNTLIFCLMMVGTQVLVNPLAAYALSRHKPPSTYKILLFCMATMAFPAEVTMIPSFLLLKRFPLWPLLIGAAATFVTLLVLARTARRAPEWLRGTIAVGTGAITGFYLVPQAMAALGFSSTETLLNSFTALVWPTMANGFFIFLLKGFFDSLPQELYEAADIDGAGEFTKFWNITMSLSKPILAVIALGAFTAAYSAFMQALIIIPDRSMWTIMVWLFQLQAEHASFQPVVYASLVIAAIPTLLVFVFCQNIIIRGIVVPVDK